MLLINAVEVGPAPLRKPSPAQARGMAEVAPGIGRVCQEYGRKPDAPLRGIRACALTADSADGRNSQPVGNLTYTQALLLLGLPQEERAEFIARHDVGKMSKQERRQALSNPKY